MCRRFAPGQVIQSGERVSYDDGNIQKYIGEEETEMSWKEIPTTSDLYETINLEAEGYQEEKTYSKGAYVFNDGRFFKSLIGRNDQEPDNTDAWKKLTIG